MSVDPLTNNFAFYTPYQFAGNRPIAAVDLDGLEELIKTTTVRYRVNEATDGSKLHGYYPKSYSQNVYSTQLTNPTDKTLKKMTSFRSDADMNDDWSGTTASGTRQSSSAIENKYGTGFDPHKLNLLTLPGNAKGQSNYDAFKDEGADVGDLYVGLKLEKNGTLNGTVVGLVGDFGPNSQPGEQSPMANKNLLGKKTGGEDNQVIYIVFPGSDSYWKSVVGTTAKGKIAAIPTNADINTAYSNFRKDYFADEKGNGTATQKNNSNNFWKTVKLLMNEVYRNNFDNATKEETKAGRARPANDDRNKN